MFYHEETIAAISTPQGTGGIGIVRISGTEAFSIAERIFKGKRIFRDIKTHTVNFGKIIHPLTEEIIDEVILTKMEAPHTFTKENIIEINCHGSVYTVRKILEMIISMGARLATAGEFTKRAFLNGRIDLSQAEAVIDVINSKTEISSKAAIIQLEGKLSEKIRIIRKKLITLLAHIEVTVDYPEEDVEEITAQKVYDESRLLQAELSKLAKSFDRGRLIRDGLNLVIAGRPNVGKSSLLNELSGKNKAIVSEIPGTTRDIVEDIINIGGFPVRVSDTAGIRETNNEIEKIGVERAKDALTKADLVAVIVDLNDGLTMEDLKIIEDIKDSKVIILANKSDIAKPSQIEELKDKLPNFEILEVSAKTGQGIVELENKIADMMQSGEISSDNDILITNVRHKYLIDKSIESIEEACMAFKAGMPLDCLSIDVKNSAEFLGQIIGESINEDVLKEIFSRFCIGK
ncbi:MAG: tRNA uridine-5-carboxymethylaminomethyl(34) synthesis GTPase MnmE [Clostridiaceae bacterium]|nr:tRNA uridine-5-carboxymethylaminomethyl(34) synthesis GTPase MnmE [Clostridiaceae bacterium]